jgi:DNA-binding HxlR family transcriptional regulator
MIAKNVNRNKSKVIGLRIPQRNWLEWKLYCNKMSLDLTTFIKLAIDDFLNIELEKYKFEKEPIELDLSKLNTKDGKIDLNQTTYFNFRIDSVKLEKWDKYCIQNRLDRTQLVLFATEKRIHPNQYLPIRDYDRTKWILNNVIREFGLMEVSFIETIFDSIDPSLLTKMLDTLESKNFIMRKGRDAYVPTGELKRTSSIRRVVENCENIVEDLRSESTTPSSDNLQPETFPFLEHESLVIVIFDYLELCLTQFKSQLDEDFSEIETTNALNQIQQLKTLMLNAFEKIKTLKA